MDLVVDLPVRLHTVAARDGAHAADATEPDDQAEGVAFRRAPVDLARGVDVGRSGADVDARETARIHLPHHGGQDRDQTRGVDADGRRVGTAEHHRLGGRARLAGRLARPAVPVRDELDRQREQVVEGGLIRVRLGITQLERADREPRRGRLVERAFLGRGQAWEHQQQAGEQAHRSRASSSDRRGGPAVVSLRRVSSLQRRGRFPASAERRACGSERIGCDEGPFEPDVGPPALAEKRARRCRSAGRPGGRRGPPRGTERRAGHPASVARLERAGR